MEVREISAICNCVEAILEVLGNSIGQTCVRSAVIQL